MANPAVCADIPESCVHNIGTLKIIQVSRPRTLGPEDSPTMTSISSPGTRKRRTYDHRLREHVVRAGAMSLGHRLAIPRSTVSTWQRRGLRPVVTVEILEQDRQQLLESIARLDRRARVLAAVVRLLLALLRVSEFDLSGRRLPEGAAKADILRSLESARPWLALGLILRVLRLEPARYHARAFWCSLKHQWLYLNSLDSVERLRTLVAFYIEQHNSQMPQSAFSGQTPDEMYFGMAANLPSELAAARQLARAARLATNRRLSCERCRSEQVIAPGSKIPP